MRNVDTYVKVLSLTAFVLVVYWRDLGVLLSTAFSFKWIGFTSAIIPLTFWFLFQRRKALDVFATVQEGKHTWGILLIILAILTYTLGSYSEYALWFHVSSLIIFLIAYLMLRVDFRVSKIALLPTVALAIMSLWVTPSAAFIENVTTSVIVYLVSGVYLAFLVIAILLATFKRVLAQQPCIVCQSKATRREAFCPHCGKQRSVLTKTSSPKYAIAGFLILLIIVSILTFLFVPVLALADQGAIVTFYTAHGPETQPIVETPMGWILKSSTRLSTYESENFEDFAVLNKYVEERYAENKSYVLLEISRAEQSPYRMNGWRIAEWERTVGGRVVLADSIMGEYVILRRQKNTIIALYNTSPFKLLFKTSLSFETKNVGFSIFMNLTNFAESETPQVLTQLINIGESIVRRWINLQLWTVHASTLTKLYAQFGDIFYTVIGVVCVFSIAGWARARDDKEARLIDKTLSLQKDEALLLAVALRAKEGQTGKELYNAYRRLAEIDVSRFHEKLNRLVELGLMKKHYKLKNREVSLMWKTAI